MASAGDASMPPSWLSECHNQQIGADWEHGDGQPTAASFRIDGIQKGPDLSGPWPSGQGPIGDPTSFRNTFGLLMPDIQGCSESLPGDTNPLPNHSGTHKHFETRQHLDQFDSNQNEPWSAPKGCIAGTTDDTGSPAFCLCRSCVGAALEFGGDGVYQQEVPAANQMFSNIVAGGSTWSLAGHQSDFTRSQAQHLYPTVLATEIENNFQGEIMILDKPSQMKFQVKPQFPSGFSSSESFMLSSSESSAEGYSFHMLGGRHSPTREKLPPMLPPVQRKRDQSGMSRSHESSSDRSPKDAYRQLEINYVYLPYPSEVQKQALAIVVGLSYNQVREFYDEKHSQMLVSAGDRAQSDENRGLLGIQTLTKEDILFSDNRLSDSAYYTCSSSESSAAPKRAKMHEHGPVASASEERPRGSLRGRGKATLGKTPQNSQTAEPPKPYQCTWSGCCLRFRSKRDWRRHEEQVHCLQWTWTCPVPVVTNRQNPNDAVCGRVFKRDDKFRDHIRDDHGCTVGSMVEDNRQPLFPASPFRKECGFCGEKLPTWQYRSDHIADHFMSGKDMSMWRDPWPRDSQRDDFDSEDDDDHNDNDDSGDSHGRGNSTSDKDRSSGNEPKDHCSGNDSPRKSQHKDQHGSGNKGPHDYKSASLPRLSEKVLCHRGPKSASLQANTGSDSSDTLETRRVKKSIALALPTGRVTRAKKSQPEYACGQCDPSKVRVFGTRGEDLKRHQIGYQKPAYPCTFEGCDKAFHRPYLRDRHMSRHESEGTSDNSGLGSEHKTENVDKAKKPRRISSPSSYIPVPCSPLSPRRSQTNFEGVFGAHKRRIALGLGDIDHGLRSILDSPFPTQPLHDEIIPIPSARWACTVGECEGSGEMNNYGGTKSAKDAEFNRKDLFTQHQRRMRLVDTPLSVPKSGRLSDSSDPTPAYSFANYKSQAENSSTPRQTSTTLIGHGHRHFQRHTPADDPDLPLMPRNIHNYHIGIHHEESVAASSTVARKGSADFASNKIFATIMSSQPGTLQGLPQVDNGRRFSEERNVKQEDVYGYKAPPSVKATLESIALGTNEENLQPLNQIDRLLECEVDGCVDLPQIVVVGDQSSGKSSALEAITGIPFPRSSIKTIPKEIRPEVLQLLRKYYTEVRLQGRTSSDGSRTSAPTHSEASIGTSITDNTPTFSINNQPVKREPVRKPLDSVTRARKALLRKLGACQEDCRKRKVKCHIWHHSLRDLLEVERRPGDKEIIEWGMTFDAEFQTPVAQATCFFDLPSDTPMPYALVIEETDVSLLPPRSGLYGPGSGLYDDTSPAVAQLAYRYSAPVMSRPLFLGTRDGTLRPTHYDEVYLVNDMNFETFPGTQWDLSCDLIEADAVSFYLLSERGKFKAAEEMHRRALELKEKLLGPKNLDTLASVSNIASAFMSQGRFEAAEEMYRRVIQLREKVLGPEHAHTLESMNNLALVFYSQGKYEAAEEIYQRALELWGKVLGPEHPGTLTSVSNIALVLRSQGKFEAAEGLSRSVAMPQESEIDEEGDQIAGSPPSGTGNERLKGISSEETRPNWSSGGNLDGQPGVAHEDCRMEHSIQFDDEGGDGDDERASDDDNGD